MLSSGPTFCLSRSAVFLAVEVFKALRSRPVLNANA
jgi:hypothetical protein